VIPPAAAVKGVVVSGASLAILQAAGAMGPLSSPGEFPWLAQVEHLGLTGALLIAVVVLYRSNVKKDEQLIIATEHNTAALTAQIETNRELRKIIEDSVHAKQELKAAIDLLGKSLGELPCQRAEYEVGRNKR
jgi:hypothetical protein